ncbi:MAG: hypothetical protein ACR2MG_20945 [Pyrinomonadaceae bacterium]
MNRKEEGGKFADLLFQSALWFTIWTQHYYSGHFNGIDIEIYGTFEKSLSEAKAKIAAVEKQFTVFKKIDFGDSEPAHSAIKIDIPENE